VLDLARPGGEVEHALPGYERGCFDHPVRDRRGRLAPGRELASPSGRRGFPALEALAALAVVVAPGGRAI
jgi:hypothetical protein